MHGYQGIDAMSSAQVESLLSIILKTKKAVKNPSANKDVNGQTTTKRYVSAKRKLKGKS